MAEGRTGGLADRARRGVRLRKERLSRSSRLATARARLRPTYLLIGAQKAGTSSLHRRLRDHPAVETARIKEVEYFNKRYAWGERWYRSQFPLPFPLAARARHRGGDGEPVVGEATAAYLFDPRVPLRAHAFDPGLKLIAILREPVARAFSHYRMELRWRRETRSFEDALLREEAEHPKNLERIASNPLAPVGFGPSYVARGRYAEQLERWLTFFPRGQLLVLLYEELVADPGGQLAAVASFLEIPAFPEGAFPHLGAQEYEPMDAGTRERLQALFAPENRRLEEILGRSLPWPGADA